MPALFAVTPNPALDITLSLDNLVPGATHRIPGAVRRLGGKGINVASVASEQGFPAVALGPVSGASLSEFEAHCTNGTASPLPTGLRCQFSDTPVPLRCTVAVHQTAQDATSIINERGTAHPTEVFDHMLETLAGELETTPGSAVTFSGSLPLDAPDDLVPRLAGICRDTDTPLVVDSFGDPLVQACEHGASIVTPNAEELEATTGHTDVADGARELLRRGAKTVVVTLGSDGIYALSQPGTGARQGVRIRLNQSLQGNPTGAGDALTSALATGLMQVASPKDRTLPDVLARAVCWSASAVLQPTAGSIGDRWADLLPEIRIS